MNIAPITICAAPTAGKAVLLALLEGNPSVFSTPLWHDNVSAALCKFVPLAQRVPNGLAEGIYGNNLQRNIVDWNPYLYRNFIFFICQIMNK